MSTVFDCDIKPASCKLVLLAYADHADDSGGSVFPCVETISKKAGIGKRQVQRIRSAFERAGVMQAVGKTNKGTIIYRIDIERIKKFQSDGGMTLATSPGGVVEVA